MMNAQADKSAEARWAQENGMYTFQAKTPGEFVRKALEYDLTPVAAQIRCPTLIADVESENSFAGEARKLDDRRRPLPDRVPQPRSAAHHGLARRDGALTPRSTL